MQAGVTTRVRFGGFEFDLKAGELRAGTRRVHLQEQPFQILLLLVERPGDLVTREEIKRKLWPNDTVVEFAYSIHTAIKKLRQALGDSGDNPKYIETIAKRGYRLIPPAEWLSSGAADEREARIGSTTATLALEVGTLIGQRVSHYRVLDILGGGGMGVVYRAEDLKLGRRVALKFLPEELASDSVATERFAREARAASQLNHVNICTIHEVGEHAGQPFLAMELLEGQTLRDRLANAEEDAGIPLNELLNLGLQITSGLEAAHEKGIIHRDIKPANIFLTRKGVVKILDFGLAKLLQADEPETTPAAVDSLPSDKLVAQDLTRTGVALGTAAYMSPEQVRGERLDCRTDLFSLGLVLYEMATGQRAFAGNTVAEAHDAVLNREARPARQLSPTLPAKVEQVIGKSLQKDREQRYQNASEITTDLLAVRSGSQATRRRWWLTVAAAVTLIAVAAFVSLWRRDFQPLPDLKLQQLTSNFTENPVRAGAISPDGRYLAYADLKGIHVKQLETGRVHDLPQPEAIKQTVIAWDGLQWFPDNTAVLATNVPPPERASLVQHPSIWAFPIAGLPPRLLRDNANAPWISPDGRSIAFGTNPGQFGNREIWLMNVDGQQPHLLLRTVGDAGLLGSQWIGENRIAYLRLDNSGAAFETRDLTTGMETAALSFPNDDNLTSGLVLQDGRILYVLTKPTPNDYDCNLWQIRVDTRTGERIDGPRQLTNWTGFCVDLQNVTADSRVTYLKWVGEASIYAADLLPGAMHISNPRRVTPGDRYWISGWTRDSKEIIFIAKHNGRWGIFRQNPSHDASEPIVVSFPYEPFVGQTEKPSPRISPDGSLLLYTTVNNQNVASTRYQLMRVPIAGGASELILLGNFYGPPDCAMSPATTCVIAERSPDLKEISFTAFDPVGGRGLQLASFAANPAVTYRWRISPDGRRIAAVNNLDNHIDILLLNSKGRRQIAVERYSSLDSVNWAPDGNGVYVSSLNQAGSVLLFVDLLGNVSSVWKQEGGLGTWGIPSPDGRHLAMQSWTLENNLWMMDISGVR